MKPVLFSLWGWEVHSYGLLLAVAFFIAVLGVSRAVRRLDIHPDVIVDLAIWVLVGAIVGARLAYVITEYHYYMNAPLEIIKVNSGGLAFHGGLIGGFLAGFWFLRHKKIYPWKLADVVAPYIALGYAIVRVGCLLNGCCYGKPAQLPWAFACRAGDITHRHPTQLYSMIGSLILVGILWRFRNHRRFPGFLFLLYIGLYSIMRFIVEIYRESPMVFPWLSLAQLVCVILAVSAFTTIWLIERHLRVRGKETRDAAPEA